MVLIFESHKDFVHERLCKFTPEIEANRNLSFLLYKFVGLDTSGKVCGIQMGYFHNWAGKHF